MTAALVLIALTVFRLVVPLTLLLLAGTLLSQRQGKRT